MSDNTTQDIKRLHHEFLEIYVRVSNLSHLATTLDKEIEKSVKDMDKWREKFMKVFQKEILDDKKGAQG